jgi:transcriptional regulator with XRE-family HTH domain
MQEEGTKDSMKNLRQSSRLTPGLLPSNLNVAELRELERRLMDEQDRLAICERCKTAREMAGLEQEELGELLQPPRGDRTIYNYETFRPPLKYLRQWAEITNVTYDWLLRGVEPISPSQQPEEDLRALREDYAAALAEVRDAAQLLREERALQQELLDRVRELLDRPAQPAPAQQTA